MLGNIAYTFGGFVHKAVHLKKRNKKIPVRSGLQTYMKVSLWRTEKMSWTPRVCGEGVGWVKCGTKI